MSRQIAGQNIHSSRIGENETSKVHCHAFRKVEDTMKIHPSINRFALVTLSLSALTALVAGSALAAPLELSVHTDTKLGTFLTDSSGLTLYIFTKDSKNSSVCEGGCAAAWPPLLATGVVHLPNGALGRLTTFKRADGTRQVAYNGEPLYYWKNDGKAGDTTGQGVGNVWYTANLGPTLQVSKNDALGDFLTGPNGRTLYLFTKDEAAKSNCADKCLEAWPPLLVSYQPQVSAKLSSKVGTFKRADGSLQVMYDNKPLYYWKNDVKPGDTTGQGVGNVWYVLKP